MHLDRSLIGVHQAGQHTDQRRLACPVASQERPGLAAPNLEADSGQGHGGSVLLTNTLDVDGQIFGGDCHFILSGMALKRVSDGEPHPTGEVVHAIGRQFVMRAPLLWVVPHGSATATT